MQNEPKNVNTIQDLAVIMFRGFAGIHEQFGEVNSRLSNLEKGQEELRASVSNLEAGQEKLEISVSNLEAGQEKLEISVSNLEKGQEELEKKIEDEIESLALMTKHGFDEMSGNFREVNEEIDQVKNHVIGIERRVTKLEEARAEIK